MVQEEGGHVRGKRTTGMKSNVELGVHGEVQQREAVGGILLVHVSASGEKFLDHIEREVLHGDANR